MSTRIPKEARLIRAAAVHVGDAVCFERPTANYIVEEIEYGSEGAIRHRFYNDTGSVTYDRADYLWVVSVGSGMDGTKNAD